MSICCLVRFAITRLTIRLRWPEGNDAERARCERLADLVADPAVCYARARPSTRANALIRARVNARLAAFDIRDRGTRDHFEQPMAALSETDRSPTVCRRHHVLPLSPGRLAAGSATLRSTRTDPRRRKTRRAFAPLRRCRPVEYACTGAHVPWKWKQTTVADQSR